MKVERRSLLSGKKSIREINVSKEKLADWSDTPRMQREFIQIFFSELSGDDREFILTGITPKEWNEMFPPDEKYDEDESEFQEEAP